MKIDIKALKNAVHQFRDGQKVVIAQCPACAEEGYDLNHKDHLIVYPSGAFGCVVNPGDKEHNREILRLAGSRDPKPKLFQAPKKPFVPRSPVIEANIIYLSLAPNLLLAGTPVSNEEE
jgi:hypothetical protein